MHERSEYWQKVFEDELGVTSLTALQLVGGESYYHLTKFVKHPWEQKALRLLLNNESNTLMSFMGDRLKQMDKMNQRYKVIRYFLEHLKQCNSERSDDKVQLVENRLRQSLQIPLKGWVPKEKTLQELVCQLQVVLDHVSKLLEHSENMDDGAVLESASGGRALQGILLSKKLEDQLEARENLLKQPANVQFNRAAYSQTDRLEHFDNQHQEEMFKQSVDILGYSACMSASSSGFWELCVEPDTTATLKKNTENEEKLGRETFFSTLKYSCMPLASFAFSNSQYILADNVVRELKCIDHSIDQFGLHHDNVLKACKELLVKHGSHANRGPLHFGGVYWWKCSSKCFVHSELPNVQKLHCNVMRDDIFTSYVCSNASTQVDISSTKADCHGILSPNSISNTQLEVSKVGGPADVANQCEWKFGLVASNKMWSLIDRGVTLVPMWEIIKMNHSNEFKNTSSIIDILKFTWNLMIKESGENEATSTEKLANEVLQVVSRWNASGDASSDLQMKLQYLVEMKDSVIKQSLNLQVWSSLCLSKSPIQQLLRLVMDESQYSPLVSVNKEKVKQVVQSIDLNALEPADFPFKCHVSELLYGVSLHRETVIK